MMWIKYKKNTSLKIHHYTCSISKYFGSCRGKPCITKPEFSGIIHYSHCTSSNVSYTYLLFSIFNDVFLVIKRKNWVNREAGLFQYTELSVSLWIHSNVQLLFQFHRSSFSTIPKGDQRRCLILLEGSNLFVWSHVLSFYSSLYLKIYLWYQCKLSPHSL